MRIRQLLASLLLAGVFAIVFMVCTTKAGEYTWSPEPDEWCKGDLAIRGNRPTGDCFTVLTLAEPMFDCYPIENTRWVVSYSGFGGGIVASFKFPYLDSWEVQPDSDGRIPQPSLVHSLRKGMPIDELTSLLTRYAKAASAAPSRYWQERTSERLDVWKVPESLGLLHSTSFDDAR
jgi:hypothetical protein